MMKTNDYAKKTLLYGIILTLIGTIVFGIWFLDLFIFFIIPAFATLLNMLLMVRLTRLENFNQINVLVTLLIRFVIFAVTAFLIIFINRDSPILIEIGLSMVIGFTISAFSNIIYTFTNSKKI